MFFHFEVQHDAIQIINLLSKSLYYAFFLIILCAEYYQVWIIQLRTLNIDHNTKHGGETQKTYDVVVKLFYQFCLFHLTLNNIHHRYKKLRKVSFPRFFVDSGFLQIKMNFCCCEFQNWGKRQAFNIIKKEGYYGCY